MFPFLQAGIDIGNNLWMQAVERYNFHQTKKERSTLSKLEKLNILIKYLNNYWRVAHSELKSLKKNNSKLSGPEGEVKWRVISYYEFIKKIFIMHNFSIFYPVQSTVN